MNHVEILRLFEIGDEILILKEPGTWSSELNSNCPFFQEIYPLKVIIDDIRFIERNMYNYSAEHVAISAGGYGWNLSNLIKYKNIDLLNFNRIKKLKLINEI